MDHLIKPAPSRGRRMSWSTFLKAHWRALAARDFFTVEVWSWTGLLTVHILFVIDLATRRVTICGLTANPNDGWILQMARNLLDCESGALRGTRYLIVDRDTKYTSAFRLTLDREGVGVIRLPPRSTNLNAYAERFVRSVKEECLLKLIPIGQTMLRRSLREYAEHYHLERNQQVLANEQRNRAAVKGMYELFISARDFGAIAEEFFADDYVLNIPESLPYGGRYEGAAGFLDVLPRIMQTWPNITYSVGQIATGGDRVSVWLDCSGSHYLTGRSWAMPFIEEFRFHEDGKLAEQHVFYYDTAALSKAART